MTREVNGVTVEIPQEEEIEILAEWEANAKEQAATEYLRKRQSEYPSIEKQIEIIRTQGVEALNDIIRQVDEKYPEPETKNVL